MWSAYDNQTLHHSNVPISISKDLEPPPQLFFSSFKAICHVSVTWYVRQSFSQQVAINSISKYIMDIWKVHDIYKQCVQCQ